MTRNEIIDLLEKKYTEYNKASFLEEDPLQIPHLFQKKQDIEIAGLFAAILAWGQRKTILNKCHELMDRMGNSPYDFIMHSSENDLKNLVGFKHRTFNDTDLLYFVDFLKRVYSTHESLEHLISSPFKDVYSSLVTLKEFFSNSTNYLSRTGKHMASPAKGSACKRLNMYLRWMVRKEGVDLGIWNTITPADLYCPLDVHVIRVAKKLSLLKRKQSDWKACCELTNNLRSLDPKDPIKYDFALFGLGVYENF